MPVHATCFAVADNPCVSKYMTLGLEVKCMYILTFQDETYLLLRTLCELRRKHSFSLMPGQLAISQYLEGPATGHLDTGFPWFPWVQERMLRWFPPFQGASTCFSCSPPDLNSVVSNCLLSCYVK